MKCLLQWFALLALGSCAGAGCAALHPSAFQQYREAVQAVQAGAGEALRLNHQWTRESLLDKLGADPQARLTPLILETGENYSWNLPATNLLFTLKKTEEAFDKLNGVFLRYADLLARLAGNPASETARFEHLASELNAEAQAAAAAIQQAAALHGQPAPADRGTVAWFSLGFTEGLRLYQAHERRGRLREILKTNQPVVQAYAENGTRLIRILNVTFKKNYQDRAEVLHHRWQSAPLLSERREIAGSLLDLNDQFIGTVELLREWERAYELLPASHAALATALGRRESALEAVDELYQSGKRLHRLYQQLSKP